MEPQLPILEIKKLYEENEYWTVYRLARKYKTSEYLMRNAMREGGVKMRQRILSSEKDLEIAKRFLKEGVWNNRYRLSNELNIARRLIKQCGDEDFWNYVRLDFKLNSLAFFFTAKGQDILKNQYQQYTYENKEPPAVEIQEEKVGHDIDLEKHKPRSIHEFLTFK